MALPAFGPLSFSQINVELGNSPSALINLGSSAVRTLLGVPSGAISLSDGRPAAYTVVVASNQTNMDLRAYAISEGWGELDALIVEIDQGVVVSGDIQANSTAALTISGSFPGGVQLTNRGVIVGRGGDGGDGGNALSTSSFTPGLPGVTGGRAISITSPVIINNLGTIAGGGGGGGGGGSNRTGSKSRNHRTWGGSGGGGGRSSNLDSLGGLGGTATGSGSGGATPVPGQPGLPGTYAAPGLGGTTVSGGAGGTGGEWGASGSNGATTSFAAGGLGGSSGEAVNGNSNVTWLATGTRLGVIA